MKFTIIIPLYCGAKYVKALLDNIAGLSRTADLEVFLVDDHSPDNSQARIKQIIDKHSLCNDVTLICSPENRRQGGARNLALKQCTGDWVLFLDQDDKFEKMILANLEATIKNLGDGDCDLIFTNYYETGQTNREIKFNNNSIPISGPEYLATQGMPEVPWSTIYNRFFLIDNNLKFPENVRYEDTDFVMHCLMLAKNVLYQPYFSVYHTTDECQQSYIGSDFDKIRDLFLMTTRMRALTETAAATNLFLAETIFGYYIFYHKYRILRYLWRLPYNQILSILSENKVYTEQIGSLRAPYWLRLSATNPKTFTTIFWALYKPMMSTFRQLYRTIKHKDIR